MDSIFDFLFGIFILAFIIGGGALVYALIQVKVDQKKTMEEPENDRD